MVTILIPIFLVGLVLGGLCISALLDCKINCQECRAWRLQRDTLKKRLRKLETTGEEE